MSCTLAALSLFDLGTVLYRFVLGCSVQSLRLPPSIQQRLFAVSIAASAIPSWPFHSSSVLAQQLLIIALEQQMLPPIWLRDRSPQMQSCVRSLALARRMPLPLAVPISMLQPYSPALADFPGFVRAW